MINTYQINITTTTEDTCLDNLLKVKKYLEEDYAVEMLSNNSFLLVIGENVHQYKNIGKLFEITQKYDILLTSYSSNDMTLSWVVKERENELANELHQVPSKTKVLQYFTVL